MQDGSLAAQSAYAARVLKAAARGKTSYFERLQRDQAHEQRAGLGRLRHDIAAGCVMGRSGTATMLSWTKH